MSGPPREDDQLFVRTPPARELEALRLIDESPGITVAELQAALGVGRSRVKKIVSQLEAGRIRRVTPAPAAPATLDDPVASHSLPRRVAHDRAETHREDERFAVGIKPLIKGHLATYAMAVDTVERDHQHLADATDLDLTGDTRWAAVWQLSGRCIGYCHTLIDLARLGFGDAALPTARALHEADQLLNAFTDADERDIVVRWLVDDDASYVRPRDAREAVERGEKRMRAKMEEAGVAPIPSTLDLRLDLYHRMSVVSHNRRQATQAVVSERLRRMAGGKHPDPFACAAAVESLGAVIEEGVAHVGESMIGIYGWDWFEHTVRPTLATFEAIRAEMPLNERVLRILLA